MQVKEDIIRLAKQNKSIRVTAKTLTVAKSTIWYILKGKNALVSSTKSKGLYTLSENFSKSLLSFRIRFFWTDETKINLYQNDVKRQDWRWKGRADT